MPVSLGSVSSKHAVVELGAGLASSTVLTELEAARNLAEITFGAQDAFAFLHFLVLLALGADGHHRAVDMDVDVFFLDAGSSACT